MNVLIVSAKDENEEDNEESGDERKQIDDLENQDRANRSIIGSNSEKEKDTIKGRGGRILKKKTKKSKLTAKDGSSSTSSYKYQIRENGSRNKSLRKMSSQGQLQKQKYFKNGQPIETYHINKRRDLGVGLYDYKPT